MKKYLILALCLAWLPCHATQVVAQLEIFAPVDEIVIDGDNLVAPLGDATNFATAGPANGAAFTYAVRERSNNAQTNRRTVTFLQFDVSSITAADVADPSFEACFEIQHVGHLNDINPGMSLSIGLNVSGAWDDSGANDPDFAWAALSAAQSVLLDDVHLVPNSQILTIDVTPIVVGWVDGSISNQGAVLFGSPSGSGGNDSQASYLQNASIFAGVGGARLKGDVNLSGDVDFSDIAPFIAVLQSGTFQLEADCDCNAMVDFADIPAFIAILQTQ